MVGTVLGIILPCVQAIIIIPLAAELHKTRSAEGISIISEIAWIVAGMGWLVAVWVHVWQ